MHNGTYGPTKVLIAIIRGDEGFRPRPSHLIVRVEHELIVVDVVFHPLFDLLYVGCIPQIVCFGGSGSDERLVNLDGGRGRDGRDDSNECPEDGKQRFCEMHGVLLSPYCLLDGSYASRYLGLVVFGKLVMGSVMTRIRQPA